MRLYNDILLKLCVALVVGTVVGALGSLAIATLSIPVANPICAILLGFLAGGIASKLMIRPSEGTMHEADDGNSATHRLKESLSVNVPTPLQEINELSAFPSEEKHLRPSIRKNTKFERGK